MGEIRILDEALASQIAAGEVVERPASAAKELIENALDAGAGRVEITCEGGGVDLLRVVDDGRGMDRADAELCFARHATSKLHTADDLLALDTFGFRGEALASIASVAKVRMVTRAPDADVGLEVLVEGGSIEQVRDHASAVGTRVEVRDLFFNVPARRKFLKTPRTEATRIDQVVRSAALSEPAVSFRFDGGGRSTLSAPAAEAGAPLDDKRRIERALACLGKNVRDFVYPFAASTDLLDVEGYVVAPLETRRDTRGVHLSVNGRPVSDRGLVQAVRVAYRTLLEVGRQPICALDLRIDPAVVDVNVHPRKSEVRFEDPRRVHGHLIRLLGDFLLTTPWLRRAPARSYRLGADAGNNAPLLFEDPSAPPIDADASPSDAHRARARAAFEAFAARYSRPGGGTGTGVGWSRRGPGPAPAGPASFAGLGRDVRFSSLRVVGQVGRTFLVLEGPDGMVVIDQHAAHERVVFEKLRAQAATSEVPAQPLLFPAQLVLSRAEMDAVESQAEALARFGIEIEPFGDDVAMLRALPKGLDAGRAERIVRDALAELAEGDAADSLDAHTDAVCARIACHGSVRAGQRLAPEEIRALLAELDAIDLGAHCPHGRPVVRTLPLDEMARWFDRT